MIKGLPRTNCSSQMKTIETWGQDNSLFVSFLRRLRSFRTKHLALLDDHLSALCLWTFI